MKEISVNFTGKLHTAEASRALWQWDYGQRLVINGLKLPRVFETHFCCAGDSDTILCLGNKDKVDIPDICLETGRTIFAYIYLHDGNFDGETVYQITIKVNPRAKPSDREPDERQQSSLDDVIQAINSYLAGGGGGSFASDYNALVNRPRINEHVVSGTLTGDDLGLVDAADYPETYRNLIAALLALADAENNGKNIEIANGAFTAVDKKRMPEFGVQIILSPEWSGNDPYIKGVTLNGYTVTENTRVDLISDMATLRQMDADGVEALYIVNDNGTLTAYAVGGMPSAALTVSATVSEMPEEEMPEEEGG